MPAGGSLAIVGRTGSGKSTIAVLLARLLPTPHGAVFLDGADVCDLPIETVRASIGYAQQDAFLFSTTVTRNVGYSLEDPDSPEGMEIVRGAAREAQVLPEIESLPEGFDTVVGERGVQLSGGQRQRVALGRSLVREPPVLVLDDPLSAVDAKTEAAILGAIERQAAQPHGHPHHPPRRRGAALRRHHRPRRGPRRSSTAPTTSWSRTAASTPPSPKSSASKRTSPPSASSTRPSEWARR